MCVPAAAALPIMAASTIVGTGVQLYGGMQASKANQKAYAQQAAVAAWNAGKAEEGAHDAIARGEEEALAQGREVAKLRGEQAVQYAKGGVELGYGSVQDVADSTDLLAAEDRSRISKNAEREATDYRISAANYRANQQGAMMARKAERSSMYINALSTVIGGANQFAGITAKYGNPFKRR